MRVQQSKFEQLLKEFKALKQELFEISPFRIVHESESEQRYDQLFQFFFPDFRTEGWKNPLYED